MRVQGLRRSSGRSQLPYLAAPRLLRVVCATLDASSGSSLCSGQHAALLQGIPAAPFTTADLRRADLRAPWARRFQRQAAYEAVRSTLLPELEALFAQLMEGSQERDGVFREVAIRQAAPQSGRHACALLCHACALCAMHGLSAPCMRPPCAMHAHLHARLNRL